MSRAVSAAILMLPALLLTGVAAEAKGCIKGALVGGVAGHVAGHGVLGAAAGCAVGRHEANKKAREANAPAQPTR